MGLRDFFGRAGRSNGSDASDQEAEANPGPRHCFVLCNSTGPGDLSRANEVVSQVFGPGYTAECDDRIVTVTHGESVVGFLGHMPAPIPNQEAEENAEGNLLWPNGREEAAKHRSHVIVTNMGTSGTPVAAAVALSRLALVALNLFDGLGVYWGSASVCHSRPIFEDFCQDLSEEQIPVPMWLRLQFFRPSDEELGLYTLGMKAFGLMEIEVDQCSLDAEELMDFVCNIAHYLIQNGPIIADGNTVGGTEEQRILVRHLPSQIEPERRVYKIVFDA